MKKRPHGIPVVIDFEVEPMEGQKAICLRLKYAETPRAYEHQNFFDSDYAIPISRARQLLVELQELLPIKSK